LFRLKRENLEKEKALEKETARLHHAQQQLKQEQISLKVRFKRVFLEIKGLFNLYTLFSIFSQWSKESKRFQVCLLLISDFKTYVFVDYPSDHKPKQTFVIS